jgi:hypothetical protein
VDDFNFTIPDIFPEEMPTCVVMMGVVAVDVLFIDKS